MSPCGRVPDPSPELVRKAIDIALAMGARDPDQAADMAASLLMMPHLLFRPSPLMEMVRKRTPPTE